MGAIGGADTPAGSGYKIAVGGAVTSAAVVILNFAFGKLLDIDFLSYSVWFVVPVGALAGGMAAASGYYFAAKWTHTMPSKHLRRDMILIGGTTWLSYLYLAYFLMRLDDGTLVRESVTFWEYFKFQSEHAQLTFRDRGGGITGTSGELGLLGYAREALQCLGFVAGGLFMYQALGEEETCRTCRKYTKHETLLESVSPGDFDRVIAATGAVFPGLVEDAESLLGGRQLTSLSLKSSLCTGCGSRWLRPIAFTSDGGQGVHLPLRLYTVSNDLFEDVKRASTSLRAGTLNAPEEGGYDGGDA